MKYIKQKSDKQQMSRYKEIIEQLSFSSDLQLNECAIQKQRQVLQSMNIEEDSRLFKNNSMTKQQKTQRYWKQPFAFALNKVQVSMSSREFTTESEISEKTQSILFLLNQNELKGKALAQATDLINFLKEENQRLSAQVHKMRIQKQQLIEYYEQELQRANQLIQNLSEKSTKYESGNSSFAARASVLKTCRVTPVKIYKAHQEQNEENSLIFENAIQSPLSQVQRLTFFKFINQKQMELKQIRNVISSERSHLEEIQNQETYLQAAIEDEILFHKFPHQDSTLNPWDLIQVYEQQFKQWQKYSNSLKVQLYDCIDFINGFGEQFEQLKKGKLRLKQLIHFIAKKIQRQMRQKIRKKQMENEQLKQIVNELFKKIDSGHFGKSDKKL